MAISRKKALDYAEQLLSLPQRSIPVTLRQTLMGVTLLHKGRRALTKCYLNPKGMGSAVLVAQALGVSLPPLGQSVSTAVSSGVLLRAVSLSTVDPRVPELHPLIQRLLEEAEMQRAAGETIEV
jgi:hypothetical protein